MNNTTEWIDQLVDRFSREWIRGSGRPLEQYLAEADEAVRADLLTELLLMELELRVASDEAPRISDYAGRFPGLEEHVAQVFSEFREISRDLPVGWWEAVMAPHQSRSSAKRSVEAAALIDGSSSGDVQFGVNLEEFHRQLAEYQLISAKTLNRIPPGTHRSTRSLARALVMQGALTRFQVECLLRGQGKRLRVGNYIVEELLGEGGMGKVYRGRNVRVNKQVAIKEMSANPATNPIALRRFQREIRLTAQVSHTNLVTALDAEEQDGRLYLVMDYVAGKDLSRHVKQQGPMSVRDAVDCLCQAVQGLNAAHAAGILHRDIKPGNLMRTTKGEVKILDLGLATPRGEGDTEQDFGSTMSELTATGAFLGTYDFIAPEQAEDPRKVCVQSDLYSLGCTLYYLLTGAPPFASHHGIQKLTAHANAPIPSLEDKRQDVPAGLLTVYRRLLAKQPADRYPGCRELLDELRRLQALGLPTEVACIPADVAKGKKDTQTPETPFRVAREWPDLQFDETPSRERTASAQSVVRGQRRMMAIALAVPVTALALLAIIWLLQPPPMAVLRVKVDPEDAVVELLSPDGAVRMQTSGKAGSALLKAPAGAYTIRVSRDGYTAATDRVTLAGPVTNLDKPIRLLNSEAVATTDDPPEADLGLWCGSREYKVWVDSIARLPQEDQVLEIEKKLRDRNPLFNEKVTVAENALQGTLVSIQSQALHDISPLRALRDLPRFQSLTRLDLGLRRGQSGQVADLRPLRGLPLKRLVLSRNSVQDLSPLEGMPLTELVLTGCKQLTSLEPLRNMPLRELVLNETSHNFDNLDALQNLTSLEGLFVSATRLTSLQKLSKLRLKTLAVSGNPLQSLEGLDPSALSALECHQTPLKDLSVLREAKNLEILNCSETRVTDISPLADLPKLRDLNLILTPVSDFSPLDRIPNLKNLVPARPKN